MDASSRFRITVWPRQPLPRVPESRLYERVDLIDGAFVGKVYPPHPLFRRMMDERDEERGIELADQILAETPDRTIPDAGEVYLRLADVDLGDSEDILRFVNTYGPLEVRRAGLDPHADLIYYGFTLEPTSDAIVRRLLAEHDRIEDELRASGRAGKHGFIAESLGEFLFGARCLRDLLTAWRVLSGQLERDEAEWVSEVWDELRDPTEEIMRLNSNPWETGGPERLLSGYLEDALSCFSPRIQFDAFRPATPGESPPLYATLCLELFNHIIENAAYRVCANEPCQRMFVRQSGRAQHGQHRTRGVRFCSSTCARAQSQRDYRRRQSRQRRAT
jgi:hypothetical protein